MENKAISAWLPLQMTLTKYHTDLHAHVFYLFYIHLYPNTIFVIYIPFLYICICTNDCEYLVMSFPYALRWRLRLGTQTLIDVTLSKSTVYKWMKVCVDVSLDWISNFHTNYLVLFQVNYVECLRPKKEFPGLPICIFYAKWTTFKTFIKFKCF